LIDDGLVVVGLSAGDIDDPLAANCSRPPPDQRDVRLPRAFVQVRNLDGSVVWSRDFDGHGIRDGDGFSLVTGLAVDDSGIYLASEAGRTRTKDTLDRACPNKGISEDFHIRAYDFDGNEIWTQIVGSTQTDALSGIALTDEGVYVGGTTRCAVEGATSEGSADAVLMKFTK
jgi:hypothetical protein